MPAASPQLLPTFGAIAHAATPLPASQGEMPTAPECGGASEKTDMMTPFFMTPFFMTLRLYEAWPVVTRTTAAISAAREGRGLVQ
jgi:hypothetical protein